MYAFCYLWLPKIMLKRFYYRKFYQAIDIRVDDLSNISILELILRNKPQKYWGSKLNYILIVKSKYLQFVLKEILLVLTYRLLCAVGKIKCIHLLLRLWVFLKI